MKNLIQWLWERFTDAGRLYVKLHTERKRLSLDAETENLINRLYYYDFKSAGKFYLPHSVIFAFMNQNKLVWVQTDNGGKFQNVFISVNENLPERQIQKILGTVAEYDLKFAKENANEVLKILRTMLDANPMDDINTISGLLRISEVRQAKVCGTLMHIEI